MTTASVLWLRRDLRRRDHPALLAAARDADRVVVLFVLDPTLWQRAAQARRRWLAATLIALDEAYDGRLVLRHGPPEEIVPRVAEEAGAAAVHVSSETTPTGRRRDTRVRARLESVGVRWVETGSPYAVTPGRVHNGSGSPYRVFTAFHRAWQAHGWRDPAPDPADPAIAHLGSAADAWNLVRAAAGTGGAPDLPAAGEQAARERWERFLDGALRGYAEHRDRPDLDGTTRLSPYLKLGVVHPRTLLRDLRRHPGEDAERLQAELAWREFYADVLWHHPDSAWQDLRESLSGMSYDPAGEDSRDPRQTAALEAWREGRTGYPMVDAGMRQLLAEGWMHNRVRMVTASFLTKDLHVWWPLGARHFLEHLIDGDVASNSHGWQWVAGTGTDAAPYFRVFNPVTQGLRFDPAGDYVRRWVPELAHLTGAAAHEPWRHAGGYAHGYPQRIVDHADERREALRRYRAATS